MQYLVQRSTEFNWGLWEVPTEVPGGDYNPKGNLVIIYRLKHGTKISISPSKSPTGKKFHTDLVFMSFELSM